MLAPPRYAHREPYVNWSKNDALKALKMLAAVVWKREPHHRSETLLWGRVRELCPDVLRFVLGIGATLEQVVADTRRDQDRDITPHKLLDRADKTFRYAEFNTLQEVVWTAYEIALGQPVRDPKRTFTPTEKRAAAEAQGWRCYFYEYCGAIFQKQTDFQGGHDIAHARYGRSTVNNCIAVCRTCNTAQGTKSAAEHLRQLALTRGRLF